jgi:hypothetical protein
VIKNNSAGIISKADFETLKFMILWFVDKYYI